jgi:Hypoxia induced protein conserved region
MLGLAAGVGSVMYAAKRHPNFRALTVPFRAFIGVSIGTFTTIIGADRASVNFENHRNKQREALLQRHSEYERYEEAKPLAKRAKDWAAENRYSIVFAAWLASLGVSLALVRRNRYLTTSQKLVQSRVYAQGLTIAVLLASFGLEASDVANKKGRWETVKVLDPTDPMHKRLIEKQIHHEKYEGEDQWMEVIASEERRQKERQAVHEKELKTIQEATAKAHKAH